MLGEQHRYYLKSIAIYGLPLLPVLYYVWPDWDTITNGLELLSFLREILVFYIIWLGTEFALLGRIPGFKTGMARSWSIAFYGLPLLPVLYFMWPALDTITNRQEFFTFLGGFFFSYSISLGLGFAVLRTIFSFKKTEMIDSAYAGAQQRSDEQQIIVPQSARPPRGGWSEWRRR